MSDCSPVAEMVGKTRPGARTLGKGFDIVAPNCSRCGNKRYIEATAVPSQERSRWAVSSKGGLVRACPDCCINTDYPLDEQSRKLAK
jgi:hypothetical protein